MADNVQKLSQNQIIEKINNIFEEKSGLKISVESNFTDLGGNSIVAAQIAGEINQLFAINVTVTDILESDKIETFITTAVEKVFLKQDELVNTEQKQDNVFIKWPLSKDQERLWFIDRVNPGHPAFNLAAAVRVQGTLNIEYLDKIIQYVIDKHDMLKVNYYYENQKVYQFIKAISYGATSLEMVDEHELQKKMEIEASKGFNILEDNLVRFKLFKLSDTDHVIFLNIHSIIGDIWSLELILENIVEAYSKLQKGQELSIEKLKVNYNDFIQDQAARLDKNYNVQLAYWTQALKDTPSQIELRGTKKRPLNLSYKAGHLGFEVNSQTLGAIHQLVKESKSTLTMFNFLYSSYVILLNYYSDQQEFLAGCLIPNRKTQDYNSLVGFFSKTLIIKNCIFDDMTMSELLKHNYEESANSYNNSDVPSANLLQNISKNQGNSKNYVIQFMFCLLKSFSFTPLDNITVNNMEVFSGYSEYDLYLTMKTKDHTIDCSLVYSLDLFNEDTINKYKNVYLDILDILIKVPDIKMGELKKKLSI